MSFKDKVVIVTGSSSGIGASIAISFAKEGANVVVTGRNEEKLKEVEKSCAEFGKPPLIIKADVSIDSEIARLVKETIEKYGRIDILVNNAGFLRYAAVTDENCMSVFDEVMNTNIRSPLALTNLAAPYLIESKGNIINMSSIAATTPPITPKSSAYCISKAALDHLTTCVAFEMALYGVRVNAISPGPVRTDCAGNSGIDSGLLEDFWESLKERTALKRLSLPEDISDLCLYLASDKAAGITGSNIVVDNGMLLVGAADNNNNKY